MCAESRDSTEPEDRDIEVEQDEPPHGESGSEKSSESHNGGGGVEEFLAGPGLGTVEVDKVVGAPSDFAMVPAVAQSDTAALLAQIAHTLPWPTKVWPDLDAEKRHELARTIVDTREKERVAATAAARWALEPDAALFENLDPTEKKAVAEKLLLARGGAADFQVARARARTSGIEKTVALMEELRLDRRKWRGIADIGKWVFLGAVVFGALVIAYVLLFLAHDNAFDSWTIPVIIFALAVFAASPAAIFLLERPLKGIDEWTPSGEPEKDTADKPAGGDQDASAQQPPQTVHLDVRITGDKDTTTPAGGSGASG